MLLIFPTSFVKGMKAPDDVGGGFLCSDEARFITGVVLPVDGGHLAGRMAAG